MFVQSDLINIRILVEQSRVLQSTKKIHSISHIWKAENSSKILPSETFFVVMPLRLDRKFAL